MTTYTVEDIFKAMGCHWVAYDEKVFEHPLNPNKYYTRNTVNIIVEELSYRTIRTENLVAAL